MKSLTLVVFVLAAPSLFAQTAQNAPGAPAAPDRNTILTAAAHVMKEARYCALITLDEDNRPQARAVDPFPAEDSFVVWIATNATTRKVAEIKRNPQVSLYYWDAKDPGYVTLAGTAEIVDAPVEKAKRWKEEWKDFYSDRNKGSDYILIRVTPSRLEAVSYSQKVLNDPKTWAVPTVTFAPVKPAP